MSSYETYTRRMRMEPTGVCALIQDMLPFYLDGEISAHSRAFIDDHLEQCERCASFLAGGQSVQGHLRRATGLRSRTIAQDTRAQAMIARGRREVMTIVLALAGALAIFVVVFGLWVGVARTSSGDASAWEHDQTLLPPEVAPASADVMLLTPTPIPMLPTVAPPAVTPVP